MYKVGFACQVMNNTPVYKAGELIIEQVANCRNGTITVKSMEKLSETARYNKLTSKVKANLKAIKNQILYVANLPEQQRFFRITSTVFPLMDHLDYAELYDHTLMTIIDSELASIGKLIKFYGIRATTHPSQYITVSSDRPEVITNSIRHLDIHKYMFEKMGLTPQDGVVINIHSGKTSEIPLEQVEHLIPWLSFENDEKNAGHEKTLAMCQKYGIRYVFDMHHYFCETGELMVVGSSEFNKILETWGDQRPKFHISESRGYSNRAEMFKHSDYIENQTYIEYAHGFTKYGDIMVEAKMKNLASEKLFKNFLILDQK